MAKKLNEPKELADGTYLYTERQLLRITKLLADKKKAEIFEKALDDMSNSGCSKGIAVAYALDCSLSKNVTGFVRKTKIEIP